MNAGVSTTWRTPSRSKTSRPRRADASRCVNSKRICARQASVRAHSPQPWRKGCQGLFTEKNRVLIAETCVITACAFDHSILLRRKSSGEDDDQITNLLTARRKDGTEQEADRRSIRRRARSRHEGSQEWFRASRLRQAGAREPQGADGPQSADRRSDQDPGQARVQVPPR